MRALDVMSSPVYVVAPTENVAHARNLMLKHKISRVLVMEGDQICGIITKKDIGYRLRNSEPVWRRRPIDHIPISMFATPCPITVKPDTSVRQIAAMMIESMISGVPVVEGGTVTGIVTKSDLISRSSIAERLTAKVGDIMEDVVTVSRYHSLDHVIDLISERNDKVVVVNNDGSLAGIITESNLAFFQYGLETQVGLPERGVKMLRREEPAGRKAYRHVVNVSAIAEDLMSRPVITIGPEEPVSEAVAQMRTNHVNSVVVLENGDIRGIVKRDDIIQEMAQ